MTTLQQAAFEVGTGDTIPIRASRLIMKLLPCRADTGECDRIELEFTGRDDLFPACVWLVLVTLAVFVFLMRELGIPAAEPVVRNVAVDLPFMQVLHIGFVGEAGVGGYYSALLVDVVRDAQFLESGFDTFQNRLQSVVFFQMVADESFELLAFFFQLFKGARPFLGGIGGHLATVDGKQFVAQQALFVTDQQHLLEQCLNLISMAADELGQGCEMGNRVAGQRFEDDIGLAAPLDLPAGGDTAGIGKQNNGQQDSRIVGPTACVLVAITGIKNRQIELVLNQVVHGMFEGAGLKLLFIIHHENSVLIVVIGPEAGVGFGHLTAPWLFAQS